MRVTILGGGVVGLAAGVQLAEAGARITLLDPDVTRGAASWGNAGHIAVEQVAPLASAATIRSAHRRLFRRGGALDLPTAMATAWLPFAARLAMASRPARYRTGSAALRTLLAEAMPAWQRLAGHLGAQDLVRADGHFVVWESAATAAAGRASWRAADTGTATIADASDSELKSLRRLVRPEITGAIRFTGSGQISDLGALAERLERALVERGGTIQRATGAVTVQGGNAQVPGHEADFVLVAAGVASGKLLRGLHRVPIIAERGYHIRAEADRWPADLPPVVFEDRSMIVTRYATQVQAASFVEFGHAGAPPDPRKWTRLEQHVHALGLPIRAPFTRWMGARPTLPDYLPAIGRSRRAGNLLYAFGHQHLGLTLAPVTAEIVAALASGYSTGIDIRPFDIERFGRRT